MASFTRPLLRGEQNGQTVSPVSAEEAKGAVLTGASALPKDAIITFPFDSPQLFKQLRQNTKDQYNYYIGAKVNDKDRCILAGTFTRTDYNGDGKPISPEVSAWAEGFDSLHDLATALIGRKLKVVDTKRCETEWNGVKRKVSYPVLAFEA